ncbi:MAG: NAD(P)-binding domain-containing protein [Candidatus Acidiferrales bacterium]
MNSFDVICIGAGPTGLACAIEAKRAGLRPVVIDKGCLCNSLYHYPMNMQFFTTAERMEIGDLPLTTADAKPSRPEALKYYRRAAEHYGLETRLYERVSKIDGRDGAFVVHTTDAYDRPHEYHGRKIIIATGYYDLPNRMDIPGEDLPFVSHYFTDPHPYWEQDVVVIGARNSAAEAALELFRAGAHVTLVHRGSAVGEKLKYWVKPDIENRIRAGEIKALFNHCVTRFEPGRVYVVPVTTTGANADLAQRGEASQADVQSRTGVSSQSDADEFRRGGSEPARRGGTRPGEQVEAGTFRPPKEAGTNQGALAPAESGGRFGGRSFSSDMQGGTSMRALAPEASDAGRSAEKILPAAQVFAMTGYHPDFTFLMQQGIHLDPVTRRPQVNPDSLETNVPGIHVAGVVVGGLQTSDIFIENGRFHGKEIIAALTGKGRITEPAPVSPPGE